MNTNYKKLKCKVAVIGSGPGGTVTAMLLAEAGMDVLLMEEGPNLPLESCAKFSTEEMETKYRNGGLNVILANPKVPFAEGRCVGGGSEVNSGLYNRLPEEVLENWNKKYQTADLSEGVLLNYYLTIEKDLSVSVLPGDIPPESQILHAGAEKLGWKSMEVAKWYRYQKSEENGKTEWLGEKQSMTKTYIPRFLVAGGKLLPGTRVVKIKKNGDRFDLNFVSGNESGTIAAEYVFVCAGAVQTPALLLRSGISKHIGNSLQFHPYVKVAARFAEAINSDRTEIAARQVKEFTPAYSFGCSISSKSYIAVHMIDHEKDFDPEAWKKMAMFYAMISPEGKGTVRNMPGFREPLVRFNFMKSDFKLLSQALKNLCLLLLEAGSTAVFPGLKNYRKIVSKKETGAIPDHLIPSRTNLITMHLFSSCPMGENAKVCATNSYGMVHGIKNLYINDASLLCTSPGVNPQGVIMAMAMRNAVNFIENNYR